MDGLLIRAGFGCGSGLGRSALRSSVARLGLFRQNLVGIDFEGLRLGHVGEGLLDFGIPVGDDAQAYLLAEGDGDDLLLDVRLEPAGGAIDVGLCPVDALAGEEFLELGDDCVVDLEVFVDGVGGHVDGRKVEEHLLVAKFVLEASGGWSGDFFVGRDAAAAVDGAAGVSELDLAVRGVGG